VPRPKKQSDVLSPSLCIRPIHSHVVCGTRQRIIACVGCGHAYVRRGTTFFRITKQPLNKHTGSSSRVFTIKTDHVVMVLSMCVLSNKPCSPGLST